MIFCAYHQGVMMFEGPRIFFTLLMWLGWATLAIGVLLWVNGTSDPDSLNLGASLIGSGFAGAVFSIFGKMLADIGNELQALRAATEKKNG